MQKMMRILFVILIPFLISCSTEDGKNNQVDTNSPSKPSISDLAKIDVPLLNAEIFHSLVEKHRGKVLFINTWATWCVPCKEEFPDLVRLKDYYRDSDVVFIGISVDFPDEIESKVKPFLYSQQINFPIYVQDFKDPTNLIDLLNTSWRGAVPATFIYDKLGVQQAFLLGKHSFDEFRTGIEKVRKIH